MGMEIRNYYDGYENSYNTNTATFDGCSDSKANALSGEKITNTKNKNNSENQYSTVREYREYLTEKFDCLRQSEYSVAINSSVLSKALGDEKTKKWLEYNLSIMPKVVESTKAAIEARGARILKYNTTIDGYDSMKSELVTQVEADPGTEKTKKELEERIQKRREEKKEAEKKREEKLAEVAAAEKWEESHSITVIGTDVKTLTEQILDKTGTENTGAVISFDAKA